MKEFLATNEGKAAAVLLLEESTARILAALDLSADISGVGPAHRARHSHLNIDRGILNNFFHRYFISAITSAVINIFNQDDRGYIVTTGGVRGRDSKMPKKITCCGFWQ